MGSTNEAFVSLGTKYSELMRSYSNGNQVSRRFWHRVVATPLFHQLTSFVSGGNIGKSVMDEMRRLL